MAYYRVIDPVKSVVEIGVDKNSTVVFPAPLMSMIGELSAFLRQESDAAADRRRAVDGVTHWESVARP